jgi:hypothetical protein
MLSAKLKEAAGNSADATLYVDDVFSTWLYTGNGSTQTITNGIDLAGKGGMTWIKSRSAATDHKLTDTVRGATKALISDTTGAETTDSTGLTAFSSTGFSLGANSVYNTNADTYASWTFREAAKFFDVQTVTHTNGTANNIDLSVLGTVGMVIAKITTTTGDWTVWQRNLTASNNLKLNTTAAQSTTDAWLSVSGTTATLSASAPTGTYVIYGYAHNAGGFGLTGTDNVISCGSYTGNGAASNPITLGYEPQWVLLKRTDITGDWGILDTMRGWSYDGEGVLKPNTSGPTDNGNTEGNPTATGFDIGNGNYNINTRSYIYMAIRRPNKPPTTGTQVYASVVRTGTGAVGASTSFGQVTDLVFTKQRSSTQTWAWTDRLRGATKELTSAADTAETTYANDVTGFATMTGFIFGSGVSGQINTSATTYVDSLFKRAPGFFDVVCYTGNSIAGTTQAHNLTVVPEMMIVKARSTTTDWYVYVASLGNTGRLLLDTTQSLGTVNSWNNTTPSSTTFTLGGSGVGTNTSPNTYVAYLFATLAGISKVGSYTGNGTGQAIACGFGSGGARFVLIKRTDSTGNWYTFDSARGLTSGSSPYLLLNSTAAEVTGNNGVYASSGGFTLGATAITTTNIATASYIFLAVA